MTKIIKVNPVKPEKELMKIAGNIIKKGGTVAFPTETVYGIGANAYDANSAKKIFIAKGRPSDNPLIVHIDSIKNLKNVAYTPKKIMNKLNKVWPGPLTIILKKKKAIPMEVSANLETIAVRVPAHPIALDLIKYSNCPIAAPSANSSGKPSPVKVESVINDLYGKVDLIIDGGDAFFGVESTILNFLTNPPEILRPGAYTVEDLKKIFGNISISEYAKGEKYAEIAITPGMKYRHYAPNTPLFIVTNYIIKKLKKRKLNNIIILCTNENALNNVNEVIKLGSEKNLYEVARNLFESLRELDYRNAKAGFIQSFPYSGIGLAIMNRINKASGMQVIKTETMLTEIIKKYELKNV